MEKDALQSDAESLDQTVVNEADPYAQNDDSTSLQKDIRKKFF